MLLSRESPAYFSCCCYFSLVLCPSVLVQLILRFSVKTALHFTGSRNKNCVYVFYLGSTISKATSLGWLFSLKHFCNHFWLRRGNPWEWFLPKLQSCNIIRRMLFFNSFNLVLVRLKKLISQTNQKWFFPNGAQITQPTRNGWSQQNTTFNLLNWPFMNIYTLLFSCITTYIKTCQ